jgi:hypothetical protein
MMVPYLCLLAFLHASLSHAAIVFPSAESNHLEARKVAASLMTFPVPSCSSNGIIESVTSDRCVRLSPRIKGLVPRQITSGCRGKCKCEVGNNGNLCAVAKEVTHAVLAFENEDCSGRLTRIVVNQCYDMSNYTALVADC